MLFQTLEITDDVNIDSFKRSKRHFQRTLVQRLRNKNLLLQNNALNKYLRDLDKTKTIQVLFERLITTEYSRAAVKRVANGCSLDPWNTALNAMLGFAGERK
jgi:hypothetical protein